MGGLAFASGPDPIVTPRMKPHVYRAVRDQCQEKLRDLFVVVAAPIEGPAKSSFGDIDLFVAWERKDVFPPLEPASSGELVESPKEAVSRVLGAIRCKSDNKHVVTMAIPWPEAFPYSDAESNIELLPNASTNELAGEQNNDRNKDAASNNQKPPCIQVDIHICETLEYLQWMLFKHAHGDLWNILGSTIRPSGLTIDEVGLYVRIPEIEELNKTEAKVLLSTEPGGILRFLGLAFGGAQWEEPFPSDQAIFEYAATCRLFFARPKRPEEEDEGGGGGSPETDRRRLKANDRRRMNYRPLFRKWVEEFVPACRESGRYPPTGPTRDEVRAQAFASFPGAAPTYAARATAWRIRRQREALWRDVIKPAVPGDMPYERRGCCTAALKKIILHGDASFGGIVAPAGLKGEDGFFDEEAVRVWVEGNWEVVLEAAWKANHERFVAHMEESKGATKRTVSGLEKSPGGRSPSGRTGMD
ncbi:hypothetical protein GGS24DRAFT_500592 [Hypoxylon argillaceum]|nr:hypothetical protein GGS24DRAFT_500592 [Hypoxylon argillaceum]